MSRQNDGGKWHISIREIALFGILGGLTFALKVAMMGLPNIEPVSLMVMLFAVSFGRKALYPIYVYVLLEFMLYGLNLWSINYLYIWLILAAGAWLLRGTESRFLWGALSGGFGLLFGALCTPVYMAVGGIAYGFSWWIAGIPYDLIHCAGNFVIATALFPALRKPMERLYAGMQNGRGGSSDPGGEA